MTKKVLFALAFAALMLPASLRAQDDPIELSDTLFFEDFSDSAAWASSWTIEPYVSDSTVIFYRAQSYNAVVLIGATASMTTPEITIPAEATDYSFICDFFGVSRYASEDFMGGYEVTIFDVNDLDADPVTLVDGTTDFADNDLGHRVISLADWAGKTVQITFTFGNDQYFGSYLMVYEVRIGKTPKKPYYYVPLQSGATAYVETNYPIYALYYEGDTTDIEFSWTSAIGTLSTPNSINTVLRYTEPGIDTLIFTATNSYGTFADTTLVRVILCEAVEQFPWTEDFESGYDPCFSFIDNDGDGFNWKYSNDGRSMSHSGTGIMYSESYSNEYRQALFPDNWMITPALMIPEDATDFQVCWYAAGQDPNGFDAEHYSVYVSTTGKNVEDFTNAIYEGTTSHEMVQHCRSLDEYAGQTIYIAFRHHDVTDMFYLNIDDIFVGSTTGIQSAENAANVAIFPNPVCNMLNVEGENVKSVEVIDMNGRVVLTNDRAGKLDMSEVAEGVYMVRVMSLSGITTQKIVKK